jgi:chromate reductase, NAD(P)H dehydrogenase (quinone)
MITIVSGTIRPGSRTRWVAGQVLAIYEDLGLEVELLDLAELPREVFAGTAYAEKPAVWKPFADRVLASTGIVWVVPEYNGSFPGMLKHFIDMLPFPESFEGRPMAFVGLAAGQWGALRAIEQLQQIVGYRNAHIFPQRVFIPAIHEQVTDTGQWTSDSIPKRLRKQAEGFAAFVTRMAD